MNKSYIYTGILLSGFCVANAANKLAKPNIIYILADDLGYGDLSCYGQKKFSTPNIDKLASEGMLFTQHYSGCTVSAPSRSSLMTGMHTGNTPIRGNKEMPVEGQWPITDATVTIPELLKQSGYSTGAFGKWGLGTIDSEGNPNKQGFDVFYGYICQALAHSYYPQHLWHNSNKIVITENQGDNKVVYAPTLIQDKAMDFIRQNKNKPFFMYYANVIPHAELAAPEKYMAKFRGKFTPEVKYNQAENPYAKYHSQDECHTAFAAMITLLDDQVGEIVSELNRLGLTENTIIIFSSDNGPHLEGGADPDFFDSNGPLNGYKRDLYEGGIRVPMLVKWPAKIQKNTVSNHVSAFWDVMPTLCEVAGVKTKHKIDGISFLPSLTGKKQKTHNYLYWEFHELGGRMALRMDNWKLVVYNVLDKTRTSTALYNLAYDVAETKNLASQHPEIVSKMEKLMLSARTPSDVFKFEAKK